ncbi:hypothetical protein [Saccharopolyspora sp. CA-218241]|uniref:hypothetical protein n=1 Tax=Saccharopolyspora sp. CA-218241 TaxID=3240027 RepID=UPI003D95B09F
MADDLHITISADALPGPGEIATLERDGYSVLVENTQPPGEAAEEVGAPGSDDIVKYVPVDITARSSVVRHAAAVYQRRQRTRVGRYTLCDRSKKREVKRRLENEPLTNVTCAQCRNALTEEGLLQ